MLCSLCLQVVLPRKDPVSGMCGRKWQEGTCVSFNSPSRSPLTWRVYDSVKGHSVGDPGMMKTKGMMRKAANVYGRLIVCQACY